MGNRDLARARALYTLLIRYTLCYSTQDSLTAMKTTFPHDRHEVGEHLSERKRALAGARAKRRALIEAIPLDVRVAMVAAGAALIGAAYQYSSALGLFFYATIGASLVISVIGD